MGHGLIGGGLNNFLVDYKCYGNFKYFGTVCTDFSAETEVVSFDEAQSICSGDKTIYMTPSHYQNILFREAFKLKVTMNFCKMVVLHNICLFM